LGEYSVRTRIVENCIIARFREGAKSGKTQMKQSHLLALGICFTALASSNAQTVNYATGGGSSISTGLTGFQTFGDMMVGMRVRAVFDNGHTDNQVWGATGAGSGAAVGTDGSGGGWTISQSGDTFSVGSWGLSYSGNSKLRTITLFGAPGRTVFDRTNPAPGTPGSANGRDFDVTSGSTSLNITATYFDIMQINANAPVGDLYSTLSLQFNNRAGFGGQMLFSQDTDNATSDVVPEPATMVGLGLGLAAFLRRRNKK
jgi:hypothetical protein